MCPSLVVGFSLLFNFLFLPVITFCLNCLVKITLLLSLRRDGLKNVVLSPLPPQRRHLVFLSVPVFFSLQFLVFKK